MLFRYLYTTCTRHKITNESCTRPSRRDTNWIWIMRWFLQVPSYNFALHHVQFQIGSMMLAPCTQRQMGSRVFTASTMVQPGQHCTKGSIQTALPWIQTRESNEKKWDKEKRESHLECLDRSQFEMVTHPWIHFCSWPPKLPVTTGP